MNPPNRRQTPGLSATLGMLEVFSLLGIAYCALALAGMAVCSVEACTLVYYGAFFATCAVSIFGLLRWRRWGAYGLAAAVSSVALIDLLAGRSTLEDFAVVTVLMVSAAALLRPYWPRMT